MPPPVTEYAGPEASAPSVGTALATIVVDRPAIERDGRIRVVRPDGQIAWVNRPDVTAWHVASNPNARCSVVRFSNGLIGTMSR